MRALISGSTEHFGFCFSHLVKIHPIFTCLLDQHNQYTISVLIWSTRVWTFYNVGMQGGIWLSQPRSQPTFQGIIPSLTVSVTQPVCDLLSCTPFLMHRSLFWSQVYHEIFGQMPCLHLDMLWNRNSLV